MTEQQKREMAHVIENTDATPHEALAWVLAAHAARHAAERFRFPDGPPSLCQHGAETVLRAVFEAAEHRGVVLPQPAYLAPADPRQGVLDIPLDA